MPNSRCRLSKSPSPSSSSDRARSARLLSRSARRSAWRSAARWRAALLPSDSSDALRRAPAASGRRRRFWSSAWDTKNSRHSSDIGAGAGGSSSSSKTGSSQSAHDLSGPVGSGGSVDSAGFGGGSVLDPARGVGLARRLFVGGRAFARRLANSFMNPSFALVSGARSRVRRASDGSDMILGRPSSPSPRPFPRLSLSLHSLFAEMGIIARARRARPALAFATSGEGRTFASQSP